MREWYHSKMALARVVPVDSGNTADLRCWRDQKKPRDWCLVIVAGYTMAEERLRALAWRNPAVGAGNIALLQGLMSLVKAARPRVVAFATVGPGQMAKVLVWEELALRSLLKFLPAHRWVQF